MLFCFKYASVKSLELFHTYVWYQSAGEGRGQLLRVLFSIMWVPEIGIGTLGLVASGLICCPILLVLELFFCTACYYRLILMSTVGLVPTYYFVSCACV